MKGPEGVVLPAVRSLLEPYHIWMIATQYQK